jgi:hypothetical protein
MRAQRIFKLQKALFRHSVPILGRCCRTSPTVVGLVEKRFSDRFVLWENHGAMANREEYIPQLNDPVRMEGQNGRLVVVGVDASKKIAKVSTHTPPVILYIVPWTKLSHLDEQENATRIVRKAAEDH